MFRPLGVIEPAGGFPVRFVLVNGSYDYDKGQKEVQHAFAIRRPDHEVTASP